MAFSPSSQLRDPIAFSTIERASLSLLRVVWLFSFIENLFEKMHVIFRRYIIEISTEW